jgi:signal transduction histidine kinase
MGQGAEKGRQAAERRWFSSTDIVLAVTCATTVVIAAMVQHHFVLGLTLGQFEVSYFVVPALVGGTFGYILSRLRYLIGEQRRLTGELVAREQEILDMNQGLERTVATRTFELEEKQRELVHAQKMEAVGLLAGGVAHDFNNLLTVIVGGAEFLTSELAADTLEMNIAREVLNAGERSAQLTSQLLLLSRKQVSQPSIFNISEALEDLVPLLRRLAGDRIRLETDIGELGSAWCDRMQLGQVFMNLVINARDATPGDGRIFLTATRLSVAGEPSVAEIVVRDEGDGIPPALIERIFDPFFTTKPTGKGTGLGLAVARGVVEGCGGNIAVTSLEAGTSIRVRIPLTTGSPLETRDAIGTSVRSESGETILLVDDDDGVREFLSTMLDHIGYKVLTATTIAGALKELDGCDLLVTDLRLPDGEGTELIPAARSKGTPVLVITAFVTDELLSVFTETKVLHKPFTAPTLAQNLRDLLGSRT